MKVADLNEVETSLYLVWKKNGVPSNVAIAIIQAVRNRNGFPDEVANK